MKITETTVLGNLKFTGIYNTLNNHMFIRNLKDMVHILGLNKVGKSTDINAKTISLNQGLGLTMYK